MLILAHSAEVQGQVHDSASIEQILLRYDSLNTPRAARLFLIDRIERRSLRWIEPLMSYTEKRGLRSMFSSSERVLLYVLSKRYRGDSALREMLAVFSSADSPAAPSESELLQTLIKYSRENGRAIERSLHASELDPNQAEFIRLALHSTTIKGVRYVSALNRRVDQFVESALDEQLRRCADQNFRRRVVTSDLGIGLFFAYETGSTIGQGNSDEASTVYSTHGAVVGIDSWFRTVHLDFSVAIKRIRVTGEEDLSSAIEVSSTLGPDLLSASTFLRPFVGFQTGSVSNHQEWTNSIHLVSPLAGVDIGTQTQYDDPPHLNLSVRGQIGLAGYGTDLHGGLPYWSVQFRVGLSSESFSIRPERSGAEQTR